MLWGEALRLTQILACDPSSWVGAAINELDHPIERVDLTLRDLYDLQHQSKAKRKPKPYPRPWPDRTKSRPRPSVSPQVAIAALRAAGHTAPLPERFRHLEAS